MKKLKSLKSKISLIMIMTIVLVLLINSTSIFVLVRLINDIKSNNVKNIAYQANVFVNRELEKLTIIQEGIRAKYYGIDFLTTTDKQKNNVIRKKARDYIFDIQTFTSNVLYVVIFDNAGNAYKITETMAKDELDAIISLERKYSLSENSDKNENFDFFQLEPNVFKYITYMCSIAPVYQINYENLHSEKIGTIVVCAKVNNGRMMMEYESWDNLELTISKNNREFILLSPNTTKNNNKVTHIESIDLVKGGWLIKGYLYKDKTSQTIVYLSWFIIISLLFVLIILYLLQRVLQKNITNPVKEIVKFLRDNSSNVHKDVLKISVNYEMKEISNRINDVLEENRQTMRRAITQQQRLYEYELSSKESIIYALQSQINPHFFYNTLECMRTLALIHNVGEIVDIANAMADIVRYAISGDSIVLVQEELHIINQYISIMNIRYNNSFDVYFEISEEVYEQQMLKMLLQPILENVFKHGLRLPKEHGILKISGKIEEEFLVFTICDNGRGIKRKEYDYIVKMLNSNSRLYDKNQSIGMLNIHKRIKLYYGDEYGLEIRSEEGNFTEVKLKLPISE